MKIQKQALDFPIFLKKIADSGFVCNQIDIFYPVMDLIDADMDTKPL